LVQTVQVRVLATELREPTMRGRSGIPPRFQSSIRGTHTAFPSHFAEEKSNAQTFFVINRTTPLQVLINSNKTQGLYKC
jgi:hypothetical protein